MDEIKRRPRIVTVRSCLRPYPYRKAKGRSGTANYQREDRSEPDDGSGYAGPASPESSNGRPAGPDSGRAGTAAVTTTGSGKGRVSRAGCEARDCGENA